MTPEELLPDPTHSTERPTRVGHTDVRRLENATAALRASDYRNGGGRCHQDVLNHLTWGHGLLRAQASDQVRDRLVAAVADQHNLAGWTSFDTGYTARALAHYRRALELIGEHAHHALEANLRYRMGRIHLHHRAPGEALTEFTRSRAAATRAGSAHAAALASVNLAWAHAMRGEHGEAVRLLGRGQDEFTRVRGPVPSWEAFFDATDLAAMVGTVHTELAVRGHRHSTHHAISALATATRFYDKGMRRSRVFCLTMLALNHVLEGDLDGGATITIEAADRASGLASARVLDRMRPLLAHARRHRRHAGLAEATERIRQLA